VLCPTTGADRKRAAAREARVASDQVGSDSGDAPIKRKPVVPGEHTLDMIVECDDENLVCLFLQPFAMAGSADADPA